MDAYGLTGHPLGHSVSPEIHRRLFALEGLPCPYDLYPIAPEQWEEQLPKLLALKGFNVTIPYKAQILPYLDSLHESAAFYGAVNTVLRMEDGTHKGFNTDCDGFLHTLEENNIPISGRICVLGVGGVGRMFALECARQGAQVTVAIRTNSFSRSTALAKEAFDKLGVTIRTTSMDLLQDKFDLLINATPVGMFPYKDACPIKERFLAGCSAVFDCIYNPRETMLVRFAKKNGAKAVGGTAMLVWQAAAAHEYWHGQPLPREAVGAMIPEIEEYIASQYGE